MVVLRKHNRMKATVCVSITFFYTSLSPVLPSFLLWYNLMTAPTILCASPQKMSKKSPIGHPPLPQTLINLTLIPNYCVE